MNKKTYYWAVTVIFIIVGVMHAIRAFSGWEAVIGGVVIPVWMSWVFAAIALYLAYRGFHFAKK